MNIIFFSLSIKFQEKLLMDSVINPLINSSIYFIMSVFHIINL